MNTILLVFVAVRFVQYFAERILSLTNRQYYINKTHQLDAQKSLGISDEDMAKSLAYASDKFKFSMTAGWIRITVFMVFIVVGGLGWVESLAVNLAQDPDNLVVVGLFFFGILGFAGFICSLPFTYYNTFVIEERHGFNRQTKKTFLLDMLKSIAIGVILAGIILYVILKIMESAGDYWWIWAWFAMSSFGIMTAWLYPTFLAPLFNKFSDLEEGELKDQIYKLAKRVDFATDGLSVMDASKRSSHGNAYFTGVFGKKKIVLFDTLIDTMNANEVVAVLAHELGHFKLHHVRWMLIRSTLMTGLTFFALSLCLPLEEFYQAFGLSGVTHYGALVVFSLWFGLIDFFLNPIETYLSRRNEFAADKFAVAHVDEPRNLGSALLKLREKSHSLPLAHPLYSAFYYSHPPMLERLKAMNYKV